MQRNNDNNASIGKGKTSGSLDALTQERATKSNAIDIPQISLPKGGGALKGIDEKFQVNPSNGTSSFSIPLPLSPNRNGFIPALSISYNSGAGNSVLGIGWGLDFPSIQRKTDKRLPRYRDAEEEDVFMFSGVEDLVPKLEKKPDGTWTLPDSPAGAGDYVVKEYRPRIEGAFSRIERIQHPDHGMYWRVTTRDNVTTIFGRSLECRIADPEDKSHIFQWLPEMSFDDKGSVVIFTYKEENLTGIDQTLSEKNRLNGSARFVNRYLKRVWYGNALPFYPYDLPDASPYDPPRPANDFEWLFEGVFDYGEHDQNAPTPDDAGDWVTRPDPFSSYRSGFEIRTYRLLKRVLMFHRFPELNEGEPTLVRSLDVKHLLSDNQWSERETELEFLVSITQSGYIRRSDGTYSKKSLPPMEFNYQPLLWNQEVREVQQKDLVHAPVGLSGNYQWVDLYNEGINGILSEQSGGWYYKHNLGDTDGDGQVAFEPAHLVAPKPSLTGISNGVLQLQDLAANGQKQIVVNAPGVQGYFELTDDGEWEPFHAFLTRVNINLRDPNVRVFDMNGDGQPEIVLTEEQAFCWWPAEGKAGYGAPERTLKPFEEEQGPAIVFADQTQSIFLADMSGDGLTDILRIRNGEVCYWPNLGFGRFGAKVNMDQAPWFDHPDQFNPAYLQLADISGTGATDLIYLGQNQFRAWLNLSGNGWGEAEEITPFFPVEQPNRVTVTDLLGTGTACIVWSSELPAYSGAPMRYMDLMGGQKPHIMTGYRNNFGKEVAMQYQSSTHFYLKDKREGHPWITRLPFPVQVVERVEVRDRVTDALFVNRYSYHHGYYDHAEKEFRGFGRVDQYDTEDYDNWSESNSSNGQLGKEHHEPPVLTRTWFHTGAFFGQDRILKQYEKEYWYNVANLQELKDDVLDDAFIDFSQTIESLGAEEWREAVRACKGMALRQEVFALDKSDQEKIPYSVATHTAYIRLLQPRTPKQNAVLIALESEALNFSYERNPEDARVAHSINLDIDQYANVTKAAAIVYGRKTDKRSVLPNYNFDNNFQAIHQRVLDAEQHKTQVILTENDFTNNDFTNNDAFYRLPLPYQVKTFACQGEDFNKQDGFFSKEDIHKALNGLTELPYETANTVPGKRLIEHIQTRYLSNDLKNPLGLGVLESLALPWEAYQLAFTPEILRGLYGDKLPENGWENTLVELSKYEKTDGSNYWISSGKPIFLKEGRSEAVVKNEFYLPIGYEDPFEIKTEVTFDPLFLYIKSTIDALDNRTSVEAFDFRTLSPTKLKDINDNFSEVVTDELGMVVATAIYGKNAEGDTLENGDWLFTQERINAFFKNPHAEAAKLSGKATACLIYDLDRDDQQPTRVATIARETHFRTLDNGVLTENPTTKYQISIEYSDGLGNVALKKVQAEPKAGTDTLQWIGNGRTVLNNKGKPVKQYEPYFASTPDYESETDFNRNQGVTPVLYYDAIGRNIKTELPDGTFTKVEFDAWEQRSFDQNDTVLQSEWYKTNQHTDAGKKAAVHANTPSIVYLDSLGRPFFSINHNKWVVRGDLSRPDQAFEQNYPTYVDLDIEGNVHQVVDARNNVVMTCQYNMLGHRLYQLGMDNGERWMFNDCMGKPILGWDINSVNEVLEQRLLTTHYDALHRPTQIFLEKNGQRYLIEQLMYGEEVDNAKTDNLKGQIVQHRDGSGQTSNIRYDFKGNLLETQRQMPLDYKANIVDWTAPKLETEIYTLITEYDALNRMSKLYNWHRDKKEAAVYEPKYSERGVLLSEDLTIKGQKNTVVKDISYDAKGQRTRMRQNNGKTTTRYFYDEKTFRLVELRTTRHDYEPSFPDYKSGLKDEQVLQQLSYTYDPVGNITEIYDDAYKPVFFKGQKVLPQNTYEYDALYQLISATGREHYNLPAPTQHDFDWQPRQFPISDETLRGYTEQYHYDGVGNILKMQHIANGGLWTRNYQYATDSNRLIATEMGSSLSYPAYSDTPTLADHYTYDVHGSMTHIGNASASLITWDYRDMIQQYDLGGGGFAYYQYGSDKQRSRKVIEKQGNIKEERLYLGGMERYRRWRNGNTNPEEEIETYHVFEGEQRILMVEDVKKTPADGKNKEGVLFRYQYSNHLGSATVELNENGDVVSYEEYHPYGTTAYHAVNAAIKAAAKRYRYTGMERDEETGLAYHTARYYVGWLGRWMSIDFYASSMSRYEYSYNNSLSFNDANGYQPQPKFKPGLLLGLVPSPYKVDQGAGVGFEDPLLKQSIGSQQKAFEGAQTLGRDTLASTYIAGSVVIPPVLASGGALITLAAKAGVLIKTGEALLIAEGVADLGNTVIAANDVIENNFTDIQSWAKFGASVLDCLSGPSLLGEAASAQTLTKPKQAKPSTTAKTPETPRDTRPYSAQRMRSYREERYDRNNVTSTTVPPPTHRSLRRSPVDIGEGRSVGFDERGLPDFSPFSITTARVQKGNYRDEMRAATRQLKDAINKGSSIGGNFTPAQLDAIQAERPKIPGLTWHHVSGGELQLIPEEIHKKVPHIGSGAMRQGR